ncbi:DeoR/GlpR family DNA-binding transcription regulator [Tellurirhabdus rosea]|uniref:DeoR/GlpR family DNA-binding transcription regulator n=1 Tax=Tellurirhabdus rosea TaxID=2674997 RepID=UPI00225B4C86|nr:DeoR/GlpR family DNA-binding transcription regulator [Tellurirhabdus rosea]
MAFQSRHHKILAIIEQKGAAEVRELAELLQSSEMTIRRDLTQLAADGLVYRTHGGAMKVGLAPRPVKFENKAAANAERKDHIARLAAAEVEEGDILFLDCGSTVFRLCPFIRNKKITVVTNSLPVVEELMASEVAVNLVGGEVDKQRRAVHGRMAGEHLARYRATKAFVGVDGISLKSGLTAHSEKEAEITLAMAAHAQKTFLLCDSTKLERESYYQFAPLTLIHTLLTDADAPDELAEKYRQAGVNIRR